MERWQGNEENYDHITHAQPSSRITEISYAFTLRKTRITAIFGLVTVNRLEITSTRQLPKVLDVQEIFTGQKLIHKLWQETRPVKRGREQGCNRWWVIRDLSSITLLSHGQSYEEEFRNLSTAWPREMLALVIVDSSWSSGYLVSFPRISRPQETARIPSPSSRPQACHRFYHGYKHHFL